MSERINGIVKFFVEEKGWGFITPEEGGKDVFVHLSDLPEGLRTLPEQQKVTYVLADSDRKKGDGKKATQVQLS
jgi:CspA family cold shock protein